MPLKYRLFSSSWSDFVTWPRSWRLSIADLRSCISSEISFLAREAPYCVAILLRFLLEGFLDVFDDLVVRLNSFFPSMSIAVFVFPSSWIFLVRPDTSVLE